MGLRIDEKNYRKYRDINTLSIHPNYCDVDMIRYNKTVIVGGSAGGQTSLSVGVSVGGRFCGRYRFYHEAGGSAGWQIDAFGFGGRMVYRRGSVTVSKQVGLQAGRFCRWLVGPQAGS